MKNKLNHFLLRYTKLLEERFLYNSYLKNPISITIYAFLISCVVIFLLALIINSFYAAGEQYFLRIIVHGIYYQAFICYAVFIISSLFLKNWIKQHPIIYLLFFILISYHLYFLVFENQT